MKINLSVIHCILPRVPAELQDCDLGTQDWIKGHVKKFEIGILPEMVKNNSIYTDYIYLQRRIWAQVIT